MKRSQIDKAVESLTAKVVVLQLAIDALRDQQEEAKPVRARKPKAVKDSSTARVVSSTAIVP